MSTHSTKLMSVALLAACSITVQASGVQGTNLEELLVVGKKAGLAGEALSASVGTVTAEQLEHRPLLRPAEIMETVPGLVVTQHSGDGKANQYFLRGFNLDHGTDFSTFVEGMPVNMVTHGHGQGYSDLNFLIPELVDTIVYKKGPYYAENGDFSSAGSGRISLLDSIDHGMIRITGGGDNYRRAVLMDQFDIAEGHLVTALEYQQTNGPWLLEEDLTRKNLFVKYRQQRDALTFNVSLMAYEAEWRATDQIPQRLVDSGELDRFAYVTDSSGGDTHRYSVAADWLFEGDAGQLSANAYAIDYALVLTSNATYFLSDPVNGDEFTQFDERYIWGGAAKWQGELGERNRYQVGLVFRNDDIKDVGVGPSQQGVNTAFTARNQVMEMAQAGFGSVQTQWTDYLATTVGLRFQRIAIDVESLGSDSDDLLSPQLNIQLGPWANTEFFINYGQGFHSNDARGVVAAIDPVPLFAKSEGAELGLRTAVFEATQLSFAVFALDLDSELIFVGDDGTTEPRGATRRTGWEFSVYFQPFSWLIVDADATQSRAFFKDRLNGQSQRVPDAVERVMSLGISTSLPGGWFGGLRWRYLGSRSLTEDNSVRSDSTSIVNLNSGYRLKNGVTVGLQVINLLDTEANDITYLYESLTASESLAGNTPTLDKHFHPVEPRTVRATIGYEF